VHGVVGRTLAFHIGSNPCTAYFHIILHQPSAVLNAFAMTITGLPCSAHIATSLAGLHWLRAAERIKLKSATLTYRCMHCAVPRYLSAQLTRIADIPSRRRLRSSVTYALLVRSTRLVTVGDQAFPIAVAKLWNELPGNVTASVFLTAFRRQLKTFLFCVGLSYTDS